RVPPRSRWCSTATIVIRSASPSSARPQGQDTHLLTDPSAANSIHHTPKFPDRFSWVCVGSSMEMFRSDQIAAICGEEQPCTLSAFYALFVDFCGYRHVRGLRTRAARGGSTGHGGVRSGGGGVQARVRLLAGRCLSEFPRCPIR